MNAPTIKISKMNNTKMIAGPSPFSRQQFIKLPPLFVFSIIVYGSFLDWCMLKTCIFKEALL